MRLARGCKQSFRLPRPSLSQRIVAGAALGVGVTVILFATVVAWTIHESFEAAYQARVTLAESMASRLDDLLRYTLGALDREAVDLNSRPYPPSDREMDRHLNALAERLGSATIIALADARGIPSRIRGADEFSAEETVCQWVALAALATAARQIAEDELPVGNRDVRACVVVPILDARGQPAGALIAAVDPDHPSLNLLPAGQVGDGILAQLTTSSGQILAGTAGFSPRAGLEHEAAQRHHRQSPIGLSGSRSGLRFDPEPRCGLCSGFTIA